MNETSRECILQIPLSPELGSKINDRIIMVVIFFPQVRTPNSLPNDKI